ncbi:hypothetical protein IOD16_21865 [Saccharothrix sp. 6-C]|uniref:hypothetical protein n=1 Tax=Saccharothrix sp. 6-C TaxID=2781735 RepID=UPI001916E9F6|nr:hypothetical protein [Saccharothrix sp. 6-C]QQQ73889.1 hypothetical protein IOD16_21865 [Saccharothrix sp. 6-C]
MTGICHRATARRDLRPRVVRLRRVVAPLFSAARMRAAHPRLLVIAERLLARLDDGEVDLVEDFTTRYPLAVLCDLLDIPDGARRHRGAGAGSCTPTTRTTWGRRWPLSPTSRVRLPRSTTSATAGPAAARAAGSTRFPCCGGDRRSHCDTHSIV